MQKKHLIGYPITALLMLGVGAAGQQDPVTTPVAAPAVTRTVATPGPTVTVEKPGPTVTVTAPAKPAAQPDPKPATDDGALQEAALKMTWENMSATDREQICDGWNSAAQDFFLDVFMDSAGGDFDRKQVARFFDGKC